MWIDFEMYFGRNPNRICLWIWELKIEPGKTTRFGAVVEKPSEPNGAAREGLWGMAEFQIYC